LECQVVSPKRGIRSARSGPPLPPPRRNRGTEPILGGIALLIVGVLAGAGIVGLMNGRPSTAGASDAPSGAPSALPTDDPAALGSDAPAESTGPASPILEARMPTQVGDTALTVQSAVDATTLTSGPDGRALNAAVVHLGKQASDLELAYAFDESGATDLTVLGFRVDGIDAAAMRSVVLSAWLAAETPGVTSSSLSWSGTSVTKLEYGDDGPDEYVLTVGDSVYVVETGDPAVAQDAAAAIVGAGGSASPQPSPAAT
jgi:hypothetical protein